MNFLPFVSSLPDDLQAKYYKSMISKGTVDESLWQEITDYLETAYRSTPSIEESLAEVLKYLDPTDRAELLQIVRENNEELYEQAANKIYDFEDIISADKEAVKGVLSELGETQLIKASIGCSPALVVYLQGLFPEVSFLAERKKIGSCSINEIAQIHDKIIGRITPIACGHREGKSPQ